MNRSAKTKRIGMKTIKMIATMAAVMATIVAGMLVIW